MDPSFGSCALFTVVGERHSVRVLHVDTASGRVSASIRRLHPDPRPRGAIAAGRVYQAQVLRRVAHADHCGDAPAHLSELVPGGFAMLCGTGHPLTPARPAPSWCAWPTRAAAPWSWPWCRKAAETLRPDCLPPFATAFAC